MINILAIIYGLFLGNAITTIYYRLPKKYISIGYTHKPKCSNCLCLLRFPRYMPLSYFFYRRCKECKIIIPKIYTLIEILTSMLIFVYYKTLGEMDSELFITGSLILVYLLVFCLWIINDFKIQDKQIFLLSLLSLMYRSYGLNDHLENNIISLIILSVLCNSIKQKKFSQIIFSLGFLLDIRLSLAILVVLRLTMFTFKALKMPKKFDNFTKSKTFILFTLLVSIFSVFIKFDKKIDIKIIRYPQISVSFY